MKDDVKAPGNLIREAYFPTFVYHCDFPDAKQLNSAMIPVIRAEREQDERTIERSNLLKLGSWHSHDFLHRQSEFEVLAKRVRWSAAEMAKQMTYHADWKIEIDHMWSIINPPGSFNRSHIHPGALWSGVYYLQTPPDAGIIKFIDPRTENLVMSPRFAPTGERAQGSWTSVQFEPRPGRLIIFPGWLYHSVEPNLSEEEGEAGDRICISFNLVQKRKSKTTSSSPTKSAASVMVGS